MVICLKRGTDLHMAQLMPLSLASVKSRLVFTFLATAHPGSPGQRAIKRVSVCLIRHASFVRYFLKVCGLYAHQICGGNTWKSTKLYILWSEFSRLKLSPTLASAHYSCLDNAIGLVGRQLEAVGRKFSYYYQCLCWSNVTLNPNKLNIDLNRNTTNIKKIKIAI